MTSHLQEIEDAAARDGVNKFKTQMEILVLSLLHENRDVALVQIAEARAVSLGYLDEFDAPPISIDHVAKAGRVATALLEHSFERFRIVIESPDDDAVH
jgi:hypothetical protein